MALGANTFFSLGLKDFLSGVQVVDSRQELNQRRGDLIAVLLIRATCGISFELGNLKHFDGGFGYLLGKRLPFVPRVELILFYPLDQGGHLQALELVLGLFVVTWMESDHLAEHFAILQAHLEGNGRAPIVPADAQIGVFATNIQAADKKFDEVSWPILIVNLIALARLFLPFGFAVPRHVNREHLVLAEEVGWYLVQDGHRARGTPVDENDLVFPVVLACLQKKHISELL